MKFNLSGEYIELFKLLKVLNMANSGGMAKNMIADGEVKLNGAIETRKRAKVRPGDRVEVMDEVIEVTTS